MTHIVWLHSIYILSPAAVPASKIVVNTVNIKLWSKLDFQTVKILLVFILISGKGRDTN